MRQSLAALTTVIALVAMTACDGPGHQQTPTGTDPPTQPVPRVVRCSKQIRGGVIREYPWRRQSVIVGPVALWPARTRYPQLPEDQLRSLAVTKRGPRFPSDQLKLQIIIEEGERALLSIGESARDAAAFLFRTKYKRRGFLIGEGVQALDLRPCEGRGAHTEYSTGLIVDGPRCLPLEVTLTGRQTSLEAFLPIGTTDCPS
jgi:hypothetical protein